jgi:hypothetical protein
MGMFNDLHKQDLADRAKQGQPAEQLSKQPIKQENKQALKQVSKETIKQVSVAPAPSLSIDDEPYTQATFKFTDEELDALDDLKRDLRRQLALKTTKQNLVRYALHRLIEEFAKDGEASWLTQQLKNK